MNWSSYKRKAKMYMKSGPRKDSHAIGPMLLPLALEHSILQNNGKRSARVVGEARKPQPGLTSSRKYSPTSLITKVRSGTKAVSLRDTGGESLGTHAWWKTMIPVGSSFRVSIVDRAVTPNPYIVR